MKLIIFGINRETIDIINSIKKSHSIIGVSDNYCNEKQIEGYTFVKPQDINTVQYDYIIVCVKERKTFEIIREELLTYGIKDEKILGFRYLYYEARVDQVMLDAKDRNKIFDGLIIGISHAAYAINPQYLEGEWANIATPSEDITNHNYILDKLKKQYYEQICNVKKVVIDLYDYSVLNFVTKQSRYNIEFYDIYCGDGIENQDDFEDIENQIYERRNYSSFYARNNRDLRRSIFDDEAVFELFKRGSIRPSSSIDFFYKDCVFNEGELKEIDKGINFIPKIQRDSNISHNIMQLRRLIKGIYDINPCMEIYLILIPRVAEVERLLQAELDSYKDILYKEIDNLKKEYPLLYFRDYKGVNEFSLYTDGYCSVGHMNIKGQKKFTMRLSRDISMVNA